MTALPWRHIHPGIGPWKSREKMTGKITAEQVGADVVRLTLIADVRIVEAVASGETSNPP